MRDECYGIPVPTAEQTEARWQQSFAQFELWTQIWRDNPSLLRQAGKCAQDLMMPLSEVQRMNEQTW